MVHEYCEVLAKDSCVSAATLFCTGMRCGQDLREGWRAETREARSFSRPLTRTYRASTRTYARVCARVRVPLRQYNVKPHNLFFQRASVGDDLHNCNVEALGLPHALLATRSRHDPRLFSQELLHRTASAKAHVLFHIFGPGTPNRMLRKEAHDSLHRSLLVRATTHKVIKAREVYPAARRVCQAKPGSPGFLDLCLVDEVCLIMSPTRNFPAVSVHPPSPYSDVPVDRFGVNSTSSSTSFSTPLSPSRCSERLICVPPQASCCLSNLVTGTAACSKAFPFIDFVQSRSHATPLLHSTASGMPDSYDNIWYAETPAQMTRIISAEFETLQFPKCRGHKARSRRSAESLLLARCYNLQPHVFAPLGRACSKPDSDHVLGFVAPSPFNFMKAASDRVHFLDTPIGNPCTSVFFYKGVEREAILPFWPFVYGNGRHALSLPLPEPTDPRPASKVSS